MRGHGRYSSTRLPAITRAQRAPRQMEAMSGAIGASRKGSLPTASTRLRPRSTQDAAEEEDICGTGFACTALGPNPIRAWIAFQSVALLFQWSLWNEVRDHLDLYDTTVASQCPSDRVQHGICRGPMWNLSSWHNVSLEGRGHVDHVKENMRQKKLARLRRREEAYNRMHGIHIDSHGCDDDWEPPRQANHTFEFTTRSSPPTFLVVVDPIAKASDEDEPPPDKARSGREAEAIQEQSWHLTVERVDPPSAQRRLERDERGPSAASLEDLSAEAAKTLSEKGHVVWRATVVNTAISRRQVRFVAFVEDSTVPHLSEIHANSRCSFSRAWKAFNQQEQGKSHEVLNLCRGMMGLAIPAGALAVYAVYHFCRMGSASGFHGLVVLKFFAVDLMQQVCIVFYLFGWYEAEGLSCQLCLFHPDHCEEEHPFRLANTAAYVVTLLSAVAIQILVGPSKGRHVDEEKAALMCFARFAGLCVSILPFTTAVYWATPALLSAPVLAQVVAFVPCATGWLTVGCFFMCWIQACCKDCE